MREALVARQSGKGAHPGIRPRWRTYRFAASQFNFHSPMLDSTTLWLKSSKKKIAATLLYGWWPPSCRSSAS
jgi:hypothetical protein